MLLTDQTHCFEQKAAHCFEQKAGSDWSLRSFE
jgi:hypothetical protein